MKTIYSISFLTTLCILFSSCFFTNDANKVAKFIIKNSNKISIYYSVNDTVKLKINENRMMTLASTLKWIILIKYCQEIEEKKCSFDELISLDELKKYYYEGTDGNAHITWLSNIKDSIENNKVKLREVVKGMILYSSNANTEFLLDYFGIDSLNNFMKNNNIINHDKLNYLTSLAYVIDNLPIQELKKLNSSQMLDKTIKIHTEIKKGNIKLEKAKEIGIDDELERDSLFNYFLPKSSAKEYGLLMKKLNNKGFGANVFNNEIDSIFDVITSKNKWLKRAGSKGGSTSMVLTQSVFVEKIDGTKIELVYFFNNLSIFEYLRIRNKLNDFDFKFLLNQKEGEDLTNKILKSINN